MQETQFDGKKYQEYFQAPTEKQLMSKMDDRLKSLKESGHAFVRRVPNIMRNTKCPCGSGKKFKRCCIAKVNLVSAT